MSNSHQQIPDEVWQRALQQHEGNAVFFTEVIEQDFEAIRIGLILRDSPFVHIISGFRFGSVADAEEEAERLNELLGYHWSQMYRLQLGHRCRDKGERVTFRGYPPDCTAVWIR